MTESTTAIETIIDSETEIGVESVKDHAGKVSDDGHIRELRAESRSNRIKAREAEKRAQEAETKATQAITQIEEYRKTSNDRIIRAELKAQAIAAGMHDLDGLKLADLSSISIDDNGDVTGAEGLISALKESKPYLFKEISSTSINPQLPTERKSEGRSAMDMSEAEYKKALAKYGVR